MQFLSLQNVNKSTYTTCPLQLYLSPPDGMIELEKFKHLATSRVQVLKILETAALKYIPGSISYDDFVEKELIKINFLPNLLLRGVKTDEDPAIQEELRNDLISHFVLRLAYSTREKADLAEFLQCSKSMPSHKVMDTTFYKVPFTDVLDLVKCRKVFIRAGTAFVPSTDMVYIITNEFRKKLSFSLAKTSRCSFDIIQSDERLQQFLSQLPEGYCDHFTADQDPNTNIRSNDIDNLSKLCFPPCFRQLQEALRKDHHLKHRGIGLPMEENVKLFQSEFVGRGGMDQTKFDREHGYNIRHSYGKEGKRTSYSAFSCVKIISDHPPGHNEQHGCPFRHLNTEMLKLRMKSYGLDQNQVKQILDLCSGKHYQIACQRYFEFVHNLSDHSVCITHPNQYFNDSYLIRSKGEPTNKIFNNDVTKPFPDISNDDKMELSDDELVNLDISMNGG